MKLSINVSSFGLTLAVLLFVTLSVTAQQTQPAPDQDVVFERQVIVQGPDGPLGPSQVPSKTFAFVAMEVGFDGKLVTKAPYSAQAITETTQTLSDGNRIINKSSAMIYRDSEGRTRREQTLKAIGPYANADGPLQTIFINDPVAGISYVLDAKTHTAHKNQRFSLEFHAAPGLPGPPPEGGAPSASGPEPEVFMLKTPPPGGPTDFVFRGQKSPKNLVTESLGKQLIEGIEAEGTRVTITIAAGEIGNERPLTIVTERWYSPELQTVVMTRHDDPRAGETIYRLTNITRTEPARSLFDVPADYVVKDGPMTPEPRGIRKRVQVAQ